MKCVLLFTAILAAWISSTHGAGRKCSDMASCAEGMAKMSQEHSAESCKAMRDVMQCFDEVLADCEAEHPNMAQMDGIKQNMENVKKMIDQNCGGSGATAVTVSLGLFFSAIFAALF